MSHRFGLGLEPTHLLLSRRARGPKNAAKLPECLRCLLAVRPTYRFAHYALLSSISSLARFNVVGRQREESGLSPVHHWQPMIVAGVVATNNAATTRSYRGQGARHLPGLQRWPWWLKPRASVSCVDSRKSRLFLYGPDYMGDKASLYGGIRRSNFTGQARRCGVK
jgi:hypothetical protein